MRTPLVITLATLDAIIWAHVALQVARFFN